MFYYLAPMIKPNLGCPALVNYGDGLVFQATFVSDQQLDLKSALSGKLFLQYLAETQEVVQSRCELVDYSTCLETAHWSEQIKNSLIPLEVLSIEPPLDITQSFQWMIGGYDPNKDVEKACQTTHKQYTATLRIPNLPTLRKDLPQLFNVVQIETANTLCRINYHAVYIHEQNWRNLSFLHITDTHLAWRNDFIPSVISSHYSPEPMCYVNFNQRFRDFIDYANYLHQAGLIDFIVLTGDIVDFSNARDDPWNFITDKFIPASNFELFLWMVAGGYTNIFPHTTCNKELEVPIFTCPGNHDYRKHAYALAGTVNWWSFEVHTIKEYAGFGLTENEGLTYAMTVSVSPDFSSDEAASWIIPEETLNKSYRGIVNPDPDYIISIGQNRILCMDTGHDAGVITGAWDYLFNTDVSSENFKASSPDSIGFTDKQIEFIKNNIGSNQGVALLACHAPVLNCPTCTKSFDFPGSPRDSLEGYKFNVGVTANNFDAFCKTLFQDGRKHIDLILHGHTHVHREYEFSPSYINSSICDIKGDIFSDLLAETDDKRLWWLQQPTLLIQTPTLFSSALYKGKTCIDGKEPEDWSHPFDVLRVVIKHDVITKLQRLEIDQFPVEYPFVERVMVVQATSGHQPTGFGMLNGCLETNVRYDVGWEDVGNNTRTRSSQKELPLSSTHEAYVFITFGPSTPLSNNTIKCKRVNGPTLHVTSDRYVSLSVRLSEVQDPSGGYYYWGSFTPPPSQESYSLIMELNAYDTYDVGRIPIDANPIDYNSGPIQIDANPATVAYTQGIDQNHRVQVEPLSTNYDITETANGSKDRAYKLETLLETQKKSAILSNGKNYILVILNQQSGSLIIPNVGHVVHTLTAYASSPEGFNLSLDICDVSNNNPRENIRGEDEFQGMSTVMLSESDSTLYLVVSNPDYACQGEVSYILQVWAGVSVLDPPHQWKQILLRIPRDERRVWIEDAVQYRDPQLLIEDIKGHLNEFLTESGIVELGIRSTKEAETLHALGQLAQMSKLYQEAEELYISSANLYHRHQEVAKEVEVLRGLVDLYTAQGMKQQAKKITKKIANM